VPTVTHDDHHERGDGPALVITQGGSILESSSVSESQNFSCETSRIGPESVRVTVRGELDLASADQLEATLAAVSAEASVVVLDLRDLAFMDSTGLQVIVRTERRLREQKRRLTLVRGPSQIQRLFLMAGLEPHFQFQPHDD